MSRYNWKPLNRQQVGTYTEYFVKMELTMHGFEVYSTEVDDRGIDFVARREGGPFLEVQVKSLRSYGYVFMQKEKFELRKNVYVALGLLFEGEAPRLYLIPAKVWRNPSQPFVDRTYDGLKSKPEWGINVSRKHMHIIERYAFETTIARISRSTK